MVWAEIAFVVTVFAEVMEKLAKRVEPPTAPPRVMVLLGAVNVRLSAPLMVLRNVMLPTPGEVSIRILFVNSTGPVNNTFLLGEIMFCPRRVVPVPFCVKGPDRLNEAPAPIVKVPELLTVSGPLFVVVTELLKTKLAPVKLIPAAVLVFNAPLNVVVPVPAD